METELWEHLKSSVKPIVLYGMGNGADKIIRVMEEKNIPFHGIFASDGFVRNKTFHGMKMESYCSAREKFGDMTVLMCFGSNRPEVLRYVTDISRQQEFFAPDVPVIGGGLFDLKYYKENQSRFDSILSRLGDEKSRQTLINIIKYKISGKISYLLECQVPQSEPQNSFLTKKSRETFLDLGAYNGDTCFEFIKNNPDYRRIIAVEPDVKTFKKLQKNTESLRDILCLNVCASSFTGKGHFSMKSGRNSAVSENGAAADFSTVDDLPEVQNVSFIKMDIEGEECAALKGAEKTILSSRPRLAVAAYHRTEDLFAIPETVLSIRDDYRIYLRHFPSLPAWDTMYYFV